MNYYLIAAATLLVFLGLAHSIIGEILIFKNLRQSGLIPTEGGSHLKQRHIRILWATWHVASLLGWGIAALLFHLSSQDSASDSITQPLIIAMGASGLLVLIATKGKHPGWIVFFLITLLIWLS